MSGWCRTRILGQGESDVCRRVQGGGGITSRICSEPLLVHSGDTEEVRLDSLWTMMVFRDGGTTINWRLNWSCRGYDQWE